MSKFGLTLSRVLDHAELCSTRRRSSCATNLPRTLPECKYNFVGRSHALLSGSNEPTKVDTVKCWGLLRRRPSSKTVEDASEVKHAAVGARASCFAQCCC